MKNLLIGLMLLICPAAWAACSKPTITFPTASSNLSGQQETITWMTNVPSDSIVGYGIDNGATLTSLTDTAGVYKHAVTLTGLLPATIYSWGIRSRAISGGAPCPPADWTFYGGPAASVTFTTSAAPAGAFDYYLVPDGPQHATQGYNFYMRLMLGSLKGLPPSNNLVKVVVTGLPSNVQVRWPLVQDWGQSGTVSTTTVANDTILLYQIQYVEMKLVTNVGGSTPPGNYMLTFTASGAGIPTRTATWPLTVDASSSPFGIPATLFGNPPTTYPAIPNLATWTSAMTTYGIYNCAEDEDLLRTVRPNDPANLCTVSAGSQRCAWYYDGVRVYYNISDYLSQPSSWQTCRDNVSSVYRDGYVIPASGQIAGYTVFSQGLYLDYERNGGPTADLEALDDLDASTFNPNLGALVAVRDRQRETAYALKTDYFESKLGRSQTRFGQGTPYWLQYHVDHVLGHIDQICLSRNPIYWESFMTGLEADALLLYYEGGHQDDVRIPSAIKCLADFMYANAWNTISDDQGAFQYDLFRGELNQGIGNAGDSSFVLENMLISPMYAWLFKETGLQQYQTEGDLIWGYGSVVTGAGGQGGGLLGTIGGAYPSTPAGKEFSQYFYWSPLYVKWRSARPLPVAAVVTSPNPSPFGQPVTFTATVGPASQNFAPVPTPTGTVQFMDGGVALGSPSNLNDGVATMTIGGISVGTHSITAVYSGDLNFQPVTSPPFTHTMVKAISFFSSVALTAGSNPSLSGQSLTFAVSVSPQFNGSAIPSGTVQLKDGNSAIGSAVTLANGTASFIASALGVGIHPLTFFYGGDSNFLSSTSSPVFSQVVLSGGSVSSIVALSANGMSSSPVKVYFGEATNSRGADFLVKVTPLPTIANGQIALLEGNTQLGPTLVLDSGGQTSYLTQLPVGEHRIRAVYVGDGVNAGNTSPDLVVDRYPRPKPK